MVVDMDARIFCIVLLAAAFLGACGTVPIPVKKPAPQEPSITKISSSEATDFDETNDDNAISSPVVEEKAEPEVIPDQASLEVKEDVAEAVAAEPVAVITPIPSAAERTSDEHIKEAIKYLHKGDESKARLELESAVRQEPSNMTAINLLVQVNTPPEKYFTQKESFAYKIKKGESLSTVAKKFLDEPLKFYILAKYNGIDDPRKLKSGHTIRIPGKQKLSAKPKPKKKPKPSSSASNDEVGLKLALAQRLYDSGKYQETIDLLESIDDKGRYASKRRDLLVLTYAQYANVLTGKAELLEAEAILEKAVSMAPKNLKLKKQLTNIRNRRMAGALYNTGLQAMNNGDHNKAYEAFSKVLELNPKHEMARRKVTEIKSEVIESLHKSAMQSYRKQELNKAIELWNKVLELDPEHELAKLYRARAIGLKKRFDKL